MKYALFLRGINVGGNKKVPMSSLKSALEAIGLSDVKTLLNSGNVTFIDTASQTTLKTRIDTKLKETFDFPIPTVIRTIPQIETLLNNNPFKEIPITKDTRLYITLLANKPTSTLKIPYTTPDKAFQILKVTDTEVVSVLTVTKTKGTTDCMNILEKEFGHNITTRNWNTIQKLVK